MVAGATTLPVNGCWGNNTAGEWLLGCTVNSDQPKLQSKTLVSRKTDGRTDRQKEGGRDGKKEKRKKRKKEMLIYLAYKSAGGGGDL